MASAVAAAEKLARRRFGPGRERAGVLELAWVGDAEMRGLARRFRGRDGGTDVLAFAGGDLDPETGRVRLGEVVCNLELARRAAARHGHTAEAEAVLYAVHGLLHLLGGRDGTARDRRAMRELERAALARAGLGVSGGEWEGPGPE